MKRETAPFVLTKDFEHVIVHGSRSDAERADRWRAFVELGAAAFGVLRLHVGVFSSMFSTMKSAGLVQLANRDDVEYMHNALNYSDEPADRAWYVIDSFSVCLFGFIIDRSFDL